MDTKCLQCGRNYEAQRLTSKFCSTNCRVKYNRKNGNKEQKVGKIELDVLYNKILDLVTKMERPLPDFINKPSYDGSSFNKYSFDEQAHYQEPKRDLIRTFEQYRQLKLECENEENWIALSEKIRNAPNLSAKQKQLLLNQ